MLAVDTWLLEHNYDSIKINMQVHDALTFEIHQDIIEETTAK